MKKPVFLKWHLFFLLIIAGTLCVATALLAQNPSPPNPLTSTQKERGLSVAQRKIDTIVRKVGAQVAAAGVSATNATSINVARRFSSTLIKFDDRARMQVYVELGDVSPERLDGLRTIGSMEIEITNDELKLVQGWVPFEKLETIAALDYVLRVRRPRYGKPETGSVTSQGDSILKADQVRSTLGITGTGIKVGVLSDGANNAATSQGTGDLPGSLTVFGSCNPATTRSTCNEGTAMLEIVYDLAPGATLAMGDVTTSLDFIQRVSDLKTWGANVIVDDLSFFGEPFFEDGPVAQAYASAVAQGIVMISSAGNDGQRHYQGLFVDKKQNHNFGGGDITMHFTSSPGSVAVFLQWSNPFGQSADDYDLCLTDPSGQPLIDPTTQIPICSADVQDGTQDPLEALSLLCAGPQSCAGDVRINLFSGATQTLEMFFLGADPTEHVVSADGIFGHASVPGVISAGAISVSNPGNLTIEPYSSRGPSTVLSGTPRQTPTLTAVDCGSVTGAGGFPATFCGTSASAPHAAGVAALLLQARPALTPAQVVNALQNTAADRGSAGFDNTYGSGLIDALRAVVQVRKNGKGQITSP